MTPGALKMRDFYAIKPDAPIYQEEFGFYVLDRWKAEGHISPNAGKAELAALFGFDPPGKFSMERIWAGVKPASILFSKKRFWRLRVNMNWFRILRAAR